MGNYSAYLEAKAARMRVEGAKDAKDKKGLEEEFAWASSTASGRQAKSRAKLQNYERMADEAASARRLDFPEIQIPPGPRLGDAVVEVDAVDKAFGARTLIEALSFSLPRNGIVGVIGPNGVGKSTLLEMIVGKQRPDAGRIRVGESVVISYVDQARARIDPDRTAWQLVRDGHDFLRVGRLEIPSRAYLATFGSKGPDQQKPARMYSGGERNRFYLALALKQGGNPILLDEPTNDLDIDALSSSEDALLPFPGCAVITAHDRWFLDRVVTHILAWEGTDSQPGRWFWFEGNFAAYEQNKVDRLGPDVARPHWLPYRSLARD